MPQTDTIPVSASVASTGLGIRYIGDYAYAYGGLVQINDTAVTHLSFTTGAGIISAKISMTGAVKATDINNGEAVLFICYLNDEAVFNVKLNPKLEGLPGETIIPIIIPPLTKVEIKATSVSTAADYVCSCILAGRVYGAE